jgi:periplasmic protein TonB
MAYVDQSQSKEKTVAAIITAIIMTALGYAFYTGLAFNVIKQAAKQLNVIDINEPPPPPPKAPPPPPKETPKVTTPPIVTPPPIVQTVAPPPPVVTVPVAPPVVITPKAPPAPPPPPAPSQAVGAKPKGNPGDWVTPDDYPPSALRQEEQGVTGFKLDVGPDGKVTGCTVTKSSGFSDLDETACRLLPRRGRFSPAKDAAGNGMATTYSSSVRWQIPKD